MPALLTIVQHDIAWENKAATLAGLESLLASDAVPEGSLVVLPEMFATGFSMNVATVAENTTGPAHSVLASLARRYSCTTAGGVSAAGANGRGRNEAVVFRPDGHELARYRKQYLFSYAGEDRSYEPGTELVTFEWQGLRVCPLICYDLRFPELFREAVRAGAELFVVIANWPVAREKHWTTLLAARAIENQAFVAGVNRVGHDPRSRYAGASMVLGPRGEILADAGAAQGVATVGLDVEAMRRYRESFPALRDMQRKGGKHA